MTKMNRAIVHSSTEEGCQYVIDWFMKRLKTVSATTPTQAADGSYVSSVHFDEEEYKQDERPG